MRTSPAALSLLVPLVLLGSPARAQQASACAGAFQPEWTTVWELQRADWARLCVGGGRPGELLRRVQSQFIQRCERQAEPAVAAGKLDQGSVLALCAQGVPGRARIPGLESGAPPTEGSVLPAAAAAPDPRLTKDGARLAALGARISGQVSTDVAGLYGERGGDPGAAGAVDPAPSPKKKGAAPPPAPRKGLKIAPVPARPYQPSDARKAPYLKVLDARMSTKGVSPGAAATARALYRRLAEGLSPEILKNLVDHKTYLVVIPKDKAITDVPPFTALKGKKTFDGRKWETVRGVSNVSDGKGGFYTAVPEENFLAAGPDGLIKGYPPFYVLAHEYGHAVLHHGLPPAVPPAENRWERLKRRLLGEPPSAREVERIYQDSLKRKEKTGLGPYADANVQEFYAEAAAAYFGANYEKGKFETAATLKKVNPRIYDLLRRVYGPPDAFKAKRTK